VKPLGQRVRAERERRKWTQVHLGRLIGVDAQTISNLESGRTQTLKTENLRRLYRAFAWADDTPGEVTISVPLAGPKLAALESVASTDGLDVAGTVERIIDEWLAAHLPLDPRAGRHEGLDGISPPAGPRPAVGPTKPHSPKLPGGRKGKRGG
jgi:transcriptional regulator with XRE-family HTH domain